MPLTLSLATPADLPALVRAQFAAFHPTDTLHVLIYPSPVPVPESVIEKTVLRQQEAWKDNLTWIKVTDDETNQVVAGAKWIFWPRSGGWPEGEGERWQGSFDVDAVKKMRKERIQGPAALLDMCYVHPGWQGKGAGKLLVQWGVEKADEMGLKSFVEASPSGRPLYEKFGFVVGEHHLLNGESVREEWKAYGEPEYYWMERPEKEVSAVKS
ncbi:acyl-CoA N-acyltransferase [Stipitochalara longipes BDJ]|nr:acyl-CoA N-acyltransferase [Stipitochalara longipes BDJ]